MNPMLENTETALSSVHAGLQLAIFLHEEGLIFFVRVTMMNTIIQTYEGFGWCSTSFANRNFQVRQSGKGAESSY